MTSTPRNSFPEKGPGEHDDLALLSPEVGMGRMLAVLGVRGPDERLSG
jgi:hypothetical protein